MNAQTVTDSTISRTVRGIIAFTGMPAGVFREAVGLSRSTYYNKINGDTPWTADEVAHIAEVLGVSILDLYNGRIPADLPAWNPTGASEASRDSLSPEPEFFPLPRSPIDIPWIGPERLSA